MLIKTTPQQVIADLRDAGLYKVAKRQVRRAVRESGLEVTKHSAAVVAIAVEDWNAANAWGADHFPAVLDALEARGYLFARLDGTRGAEARALGIEAGSVLVYRKAAA